MANRFKLGLRQQKATKLSSSASIKEAERASSILPNNVPIEKIDAEDIFFLMENFLNAWPSLIQQFYAALVDRYYLDQREAPFFRYFQVSDEDTFLLNVGGQLRFSLDGVEIDKETKKEFEVAIANSIAHFIGVHLKNLTLKIDDIDYDGRSAVIKLLFKGGYSEILERENENLFNFILRRALEMRAKDLDLFQSEVNERKLKLFQLLNDAHRRSYNKYGDFEGGAYFHEIDDFLAYVFDQWEFKFFRYPSAFQPVAYEFFNDLLAEQGSHDVPDNGHDFEHWVAAKLKGAGWTASVTQASGDDGVDVIAEQGGLRVAVQCKRFKGSVGNKAVQEVYSGMKHMQLERAVVVSTGKYTKAAQDLASTTGVVLLTEHDIPHLWDLLQR